MKALSLIEPWATLVATGRKSIETRSWRTAYRGPLLICASSKSIDLAPLHAIDHLFNPLDLQRGFALCVAQLVACEPVTPALLASLSITEFSCGDYGRGRFAWTLCDVRRVDPFKVRGMPGLFDVDDGLIFYLTKGRGGSVE